MSWSVYDSSGPACRKRGCLGTPGIPTLGSDSPSARTGCKCLRHSRGWREISAQEKTTDRSPSLLRGARRIKTRATAEAWGKKCRPYKRLPTRFRHDGFDYRQIARERDAAIYEQTWNGCSDPSVCYETVRIRRREGFQIDAGLSNRRKFIQAQKRGHRRLDGTGQGIRISQIAGDNPAKRIGKSCQEVADSKR